MNRRLDGVYRQATAFIIEETVRQRSRILFLLLITFLVFTGSNGLAIKNAPKISAQDRLLQPAPEFKGQLSDADIRGDSLSTPTDENLSFGLPPNPSGREPKLTFLRGGMEIDPAKEGLEVIKAESQKDGGVVQLKVKDSSAKPALYSLVAVDPKTNNTYSQQDLAWGVLAFNPNYAVYPTKTKAELAMAVLNDRGQMVCDAALYLEITDPKGKVTSLGTGDGSIKVNVEDCQKYAVTDKPDYQGSYQPTVEGEYKVHLIAKVDRGQRELNDSFTVSPNQDFYLERQGATRIYPADPYTYNLVLHPEKSDHYLVTEKVPAGFEISELKIGFANCEIKDSLKIGNCKIENSSDGTQKLLTWGIDAKSGQDQTLSYKFDAPDISPELYQLGPASIENCGIGNSFENCDLKIENSWHEPRSWLVASDETGSASASRLWTDGFELQTTTTGVEYTANTGSPAINTTAGVTIRSGAADLETATTSGVAEGGEYDFATANTADGYYMRAYLRFATLPNARTSLLQAYDSGNTVQTSIEMTATNTLQLCNIEDDANCASPILTYATALSTNTWYRLELKEDSTTIATTKVNAKIDGVAFGADGTVNHANGIMTFRWGVLSTAHTNSPDIYWDDLAVNNDSSTDVTNGNYPGEGKVVNIKPNADAGTETWVTGAGTTCVTGGTNCYTLVDEITPDDGASNDFIKSPGTCSTASTQDFDLESSATAGIGANDAIRLASANARLDKPAGTQSAVSIALLDGAVNDLATFGTLGTAYNTNNDSAATANPIVTAIDRPGATTTNVYPWTTTTVDSMQIRVVPAGTDCAPVHNVATLWVTIEYISATGGRMFSSGFENNTTTAGYEWTAVTNTPTIDATTKRTGSYSLRANGWTSGTAEFLSYTMNAANADGPYYTRFYLHITTAPASGNENRIFSYRTSGAADMVYITLQNDLSLKLYDEDGQVGSASSVLTTTGWYRIEVQMNRNGGTNGTVEAKIDGAAAFATSSTRALSSGVDKIVVGGNLAAAAITAGDWYFDDVAINTNIGSSQNSYPGVGGIIHLRGNGNGDTVTWTVPGGAGCTTTSTCTDDIPPDDSTTDAITSTTLNQIGEVTLADATANGVASTDAIALVSVGVHFKSSSTGISAFKMRIKDASNATPLESDNILNNVTASYKTNVDTGPLKYPITAYTRPDRTDVWTAAAVDSSIIGVRETVDTADTQYITAMWALVEFYTPILTVSGNAYADEATTAWVPCDGSTANISLVRNGGTAQTTSCLDADGFYSFTVTGMSVGDPLSVFFNATDKGVAVTIIADATSPTSSITLNPRKNVVWVKGESASMTNTLLDHCDSVSPAQCSNIPYDVTSGTLTVAATYELHVQTSKTFAPGGNVSTPKLHLQGTYTGASETLTISGNGTGTSRPLYVDGGTFTAGSNTTSFTGISSREIELGSTYFNLELKGISTTTIGTTNGQTLTVNGDMTIGDGSSSLQIYLNTYNPNVNLAGNLTICPATCTSSSVDYTTGTGTFRFNPTSTKTWTDNNSVSALADIGNVSVSNGSSSPQINITSNTKLSTLSVAAGHTISSSVLGRSISFTGTSSPVIDIQGTFNETQISQIEFDGNGDITQLNANNAESSTFGNVYFSPTITADHTIQLGTNAFSASNFGVSPSSNPSYTLTVKLGNTLSTPATGSASAGGGGFGPAIGKLDTTTANHSINTGSLVIGDNGSFIANSSTITLSGTTGSLMNLHPAGSFTAGSSTVIVNSNASINLVDVLPGFTIPFTGSNALYNLTLSPALSGGAKTYTWVGSSAAATDINGNLNITPTAGAVGQGLTVNMNGDITVASTKTTTINAGDTNSPTVTLDTRPSTTDYNLSTGFLVLGDATGGADTLDAGSSASTITLTGTSGNLFTNAGTFTITSGTPTVQVTSGSGSPTLLSGTTTMYNLTINAPSATVINMGSAVTLATNGSLTVTAGVFNVDANNFTGPGASGTLTLTGSSSTLCLGGTTNSTTATCDSGATQTATRDMPTFNAYSFNSASNVIYLSDANQTVSNSLTYGNLKFTPKLATASGTKTYTFGSGNTSIAGNFDIKPKASAATTTLKVVGNTSGETITVTGTTTIQPDSTNSPSANITTLNTGTTNLTTGGFDIESNGSLIGTSTSATITIGGNYTNNGTFTAGSTTVILNGSSQQTLSGTMTSGSAFYNLTITNSSGTDDSYCSRVNFVAGVVFATAATSTNNYVITTPLVRVSYTASSTYTFNNIQWNGSATNGIYFRSSNNTTAWLLKVTGTQTDVSYVNVAWSDASVAGGSTINASNTTNTNCYNNTNWNFGTTTVNITGNAYADEATSVWSGCDNSTARISLVVDGGTASTTSCASSDGGFTFNSVTTAESGRAVSVFFNTTGGNTDKGVAVTISSGSNITLNPRKNTVWVKGELTYLSNTLLDMCDSVSPTDCANVPYHVTASALTVDSTYELHVQSSKTFAPGGAVTTEKLHLQGIYTGGSETLTISSTGAGTSRPLYVDGGTFTANTNTVAYTGQGATEIEAAGANYNNLQLYPSAGTETYTIGTASSQTLTVNGNLEINNGGTLTVQAATYNPAINLAGNLTLNNGLTYTASSGTFTFKPTGTKTWTDNGSTKQDIGIVSLASGTSTPTINQGSSVKATTINVAASHFLAPGANTLTLTGTSGTIFTVAGTFTETSSTVEFTGNGSPTALNDNTAEGSTFNNLTLDPSISADRTYQFGTSALTVNGDFLINPTASSTTKTLTVNPAANITVAATGTTTITGTTTGQSVLDLRPVSTDYTLSTGFLNITNSGAGGNKLDASSTTSATLVTLTGTTGTLWTQTNTSTGFDITSATSTVVFNPNASVTLTSNNAIAFYNLNLSPALSGGAKTYTFGSGAINVGNNFNITPTAPSPSQSLTVNMGANIIVAPTGTTTINADNTSSPIATLDTRPSTTDYDLTTGFLVIGDISGGIDTLDAGGSSSTITLTGTSGILLNNIMGGTAFIQGSSTVKVTSSSGTPRFFSGSATTKFHAITIDSTATVIDQGSQVTLENASGANFTLTNGVYNVDGTALVGPGGTNGTLTLSNSSTLCLGGTTNATNNTCDSGATQTTARTMPVFQTYSFNAASTVRYLSNVDQTVASTAGVPAYGNLILIPKMTASRAYTLGGAMTINGDFSIIPKASAGSTALTVNPGGDITLASGKNTLIQPDATNTPTAKLCLAGTTCSTGSSYNLTTSGLDIESNGTLDATGTTSAINVAGNYTNNGTFTKGSSVVTLNGSGQQTLSGGMLTTNAFYDLTITNSSGTNASDNELTGWVAGIIFDASATSTNNYTITTGSARVQYKSGSTYTFNNINWNGSACNTAIYFRNSVAGSGSWSVSVSGTQTAVDFLNVNRSNNTGATITATNTVDASNNTGWSITSGSCATSTFTQKDYRFAQPNGLDVDYTGAPAENNAYTTSGTGDDFRLRMLIRVSTANLSISGRTFKLQFGEKTGATCASGVSWADVATGSGVIRYYDGGGRADGDNLTGNAGDPDSGVTKVSQDYEEANNFTNSVAAINNGEDGLWDFSLVNNSAVGGKRYCFQAVQSDDTPLAGYDFYPEVIVDEELIFSLDSTSKTFGVIQPGANPGANQTSTLTTTTNSSTGYAIYAWSTQAMTLGVSYTISDWAGTNSSPQAFDNGEFGFGYSTDDASLAGGTANRFTASPCPGDSGTAPCYAKFVHTGPGDLVADRTSGPVSSSQDTITYRIAASGAQQAGTYNTVIIYIASVTF